MTLLYTVKKCIPEQAAGSDFLYPAAYPVYHLVAQGTGIWKSANYMDAELIIKHFGENENVF